MEVLSTLKNQSPDDPAMIRLSARVAYDDPSQEDEVFWFDFPKEFDQELSNSANAWLSCLIPLAVRLGEPLKIQGQIDRVHYENALKLMRIWNTWYPNELAVVPLDVEVSDQLDVGEPTRSLGFFSAGVDSSYSLWEHNDPNKHKRDPIDEMILILGFDIPLKNREQYLKKLELSKKAAQYFQTRIYGIATNIRETRMSMTGWGYHSHGSVLGAIGLFLERRYKRICIAATGGYKEMMPWGSHITTDCLCSTSTTHVYHDSPYMDRFDKSMVLANQPILMESLHVCNRSYDQTNCSVCEKCLRTLVTFDLLEKLEVCKSFDLNLYDLSRVKRIWMRHMFMNYDWLRIKQMAQEKGRMDIVRLVDAAFVNTKHIERNLKIAEKLMRFPLFWRPATALRNYLRESPVR